jgi:hypothetical protein
MVESMTQRLKKLIEKLEGTPSGFARRAVSIELQRICLKNPENVASLVFGTTLSIEQRSSLLFQYSRDDWGSTATRHNPKWVDMMRRYVIPKMELLPESDRRYIRWYQEVHEL